MERVLVTGGTGFLGSNLAVFLAGGGHRVRILRREHSTLRALGTAEVEHAIGDILDPATLRTALDGCDTVFHTAALVTHEARRRSEQHAVNVLGTRNVVAACLEAGIRLLVHVSSVAAIGHPEDGGVAAEETPYNWGPAPGYRRSKLLAEEEVRAGIRRGLRAVIVNPSVVIGERDVHMHGGQLIRAVRKGLVPFSTGGGMSVAYVADVVRGMVGAALHGRVGERYILAGENLTHTEIFRRVARIVGGKPPLAELPRWLVRAAAMVLEGSAAILHARPLLTSELALNAGIFNWYSSEKARRELGYAITPFDTAVLRTYRWYLANGGF